jgi:hypothetical protein
LYKFDPKIYSNTPTWIKETAGGSTTSNCGNLGLTLGRQELLLYAFSFYDSLSTVTLLDIDGNSKWQFSSVGGSNKHTMFSEYKKDTSIL